MAGSDLTVEILKDIRDELRGFRTELREEIAGVRGELEIHTERFGVVESALRDLAEQQRFVVRYTKALAERDSRLEGRVGSLESRVDKLESK